MFAQAHVVHNLLGLLEMNFTVVLVLLATKSKISCDRVHCNPESHRTMFSQTQQWLLSLNYSFLRV